MKAVSVDTNLIIPLDMIVEALRPAVIDAVVATTRTEQRARRKDAALALVDAARAVAKALARYEESKGTRDETRALNHLIAAATGVRRVLKDNSNTL